MTEDKKPKFLCCLSQWINEWQIMQLKACGKFTLSKQTANAMIKTLKSSADLCDDLLNEGYTYILTSRFQSDSLERRFLKYRQMKSGGCFLVCLREVESSEKMLQIKSLMKEDVNYWELNLKTESSQDLLCEIDFENGFQEIDLDINSKEVKAYIAGFIMKKLSKKFIFSECEALLNHDKVTICIEYTNLLSRGGLQLPGKSLASYTSHSFAKLDLAQENLFLNADNIRYAARKLLKCVGETIFVCPQHFNNAIIFINKIIINIYFNNKQMIINGRKRKDLN